VLLYPGGDAAALIEEIQRGLEQQPSTCEAVVGDETFVWAFEPLSTGGITAPDTVAWTTRLDGASRGDDLQLSEITRRRDVIVFLTYWPGDTPALRQPVASDIERAAFQEFLALRDGKLHYLESLSQD
jgi:hypothetical protein